VANLPRLPVGAEHRIVKFVCGLPPRLQRLLCGEPPVIDGLQLAPDIHTLLWLDRLVYDGSATEKSPQEKRAERLQEAQIVAHRPPIAMARVEPVTIPGPAGTMDARLFVPTEAAAPSPLLVYFHGGGWVIGGPRHPRRSLPLSRRPRRRLGPLGRLPAGTRASVPGRGRRRLCRLRVGDGQRRATGRRPRTDRRRR
jgi:hypothetical protein